MISREAMDAAKEILSLIKQAYEQKAPVLIVDIAGIIDRHTSKEVW